MTNNEPGKIVLFITPEQYRLIDAALGTHAREHVGARNAVDALDKELTRAYRSAVRTHQRHRPGSNNK